MFVVDDERDVCESIVMLLRWAGLRSRRFTDPLLFLDAIRPDTPGCVVLDVRMPHLSGLEVQQRLLRRGAFQPGVVSVLLHLSWIDVRVGDTVTAGAFVALSGDTGLAPEPLLQWRVYLHGVPVDPSALAALL